MALESYCAACTYLGERADSYGKYYCSKKGQDMYACDSKCYSFCEAYGRSTYARENMYDNSQSHKGSGGCYLTTAMCRILNYPDDNYYLQTLRTFRDTVLQKNANHLMLLVTYDIVGPTIANHLLNDPNNKEIATALFNNYIQAAVTAIENDKREDAINIYVAMTNSLLERYNVYIDQTTIINVAQNIDPDMTNELGHGRRTKVNKLKLI